MHRQVTGRALTFTFLGLVGLTALSFLVSLLPLGLVEMPLALAIATVKAGLVAIFFMHLMEEEASTVLAVLSGIFFVLLLAGFVAIEVWTRATPPLLPP